MYVPVNCDRPFSGINLASFADAYSKDKNVKVGLIPCADGGTSLAQWQPGSLLSTMQYIRQSWQAGPQQLQVFCGTRENLTADLKMSLFMKRGSQKL